MYLAIARQVGHSGCVRVRDPRVLLVVVLVCAAVAAGVLYVRDSDSHGDVEVGRSGVRVSVQSGDGGIYLERADALALVRRVGADESILASVDFVHQGVVLVAFADLCSTRDNWRLDRVSRSGSTIKVHYIGYWAPGAVCPGLAPYEVHAIAAPRADLANATTVELAIDKEKSD